MEEKKQPMPPRHPAHVLAKMEKRRRMIRTILLCLPVIALSVVLGIWIGSNSGKSNPTEPPPPVTTTAPPETTVPPDAWKTNILRSDEIPCNSDGSYVINPILYPVFGSDYQRKQISAVTFLDTLSGAPVDAWDVSEAGDGSVMAWVEPDGDLYRLTIAGEGGVSAGTSCRDLFAGYYSMTQISFGGNFHTDAVQDMSHMFLSCEALTSLDLSSFDTAAVQDMSEMFWNCCALTSLELGSFDTAAVQDMSYMFEYCPSLTSLDLSSFDTSAVQNMRRMFYKCSSLTSLDLSEKFVTTNANTFEMFLNCPAGEKYQHLLND